MARSESKSISDSFGESMERAGYERANDSRGGWQEHESSDNYESTTDRMNRHLDSYGKNNGYTNNFNNTFRNGGFSGGNRLSSESGFGGQSAISKSVNSHYQSNANKSLSQYNNPVVDQKNLTGGLFGKGGVQAPYSARQDWDNINALTPKDRIRDIAHHYVGESLSREHKGNAIGSVVSSIVGSTLEPTSMAEAIASGVTQLGLTKTGTAADALLNKEDKILGRMTPGQKAVYQTESQKVKDAFSEDMDGWGSKLKGWGATALGFVGGAATGGVGTAPIGTAAKVIADNSRYNSAMQHAADKVNSPVLNEMIIEDKAKKAQAMKDWAAMRAMAGNSEPIESQGILDRMQKQLGANNGTKSSDSMVYKIPQLVNLWNNISIK
ncbi:MAG: hypothetical protein E7A13_02320 [Haemophilus parainfluenzae]|nr:hypothetical protein [Haemophilus parainfluenzae]MDU1101116.1 hypothetical protein [Haemophilus parainfluenzae]MDU6908954.1 hypothetical protein [Haemophilus parainfluenzae]